MHAYPRNLKSWLVSLIRIAAVIFTLFFVVMIFFQERLIFFPEVLPRDFKFNFDSSTDEKWLDFQGSKINSLLFKAKNSKGLILYFHGNAGSLESWGDVAKELSERSAWDVWILDYPGFGKSGGHISSEQQLHELAKLFWDEAKKLYPSSTVLIYGRSIGTGVAVQLAADSVPNGMILESPYSSLQALAHAKFPWLPTSLLLRYRLRSDQSIAMITPPILILHGTRDEVIPIEQARKLAALMKNGSLIEIESGHHNDLGSFSQYWDSLLPWLIQRKN